MKDSVELTMEDIKKAIEFIDINKPDCNHDFDNTTGYCDICGLMWVSKQQHKELKRLFL